MRLYRPPVPISVRIVVAQRQLLRQDIAAPDRQQGERQEVYLDRLLGILAHALDAMFEPLQLDHDPALTNRKFNPRTKKYKPDANDPRYMVYRTESGHDIKTRVRGDGAQYSDLALRRKFKRIEKREREGKR